MFLNPASSNLARYKHKPRMWGNNRPSANVLVLGKNQYDSESSASRTADSMVTAVSTGQ